MSVGTFLFGIVIMWVLVEEMTLNKVLSAGLSFSAATSIHYAFGRSWVFKGTTRDVAEGYGYFLVNAGVGLALTVTLFAALISWTPINYLVARVFVSALAGFAMFVLNATLNFKSL